MKKYIIFTFIFLLVISGCSTSHNNKSVASEILTDNMTPQAVKDYKPLSDRKQIERVALNEIALIEKNTNLDIKFDYGVTVAPSNFKASAFLVKFSKPVYYNIVVWDYYWATGLLTSSVGHEMGHMILNVGDDKDWLVDRFAYCYGSTSSKDYLTDIKNIDLAFSCNDIYKR